MLAKRIIPCLDVTEGRVVKGVKFLNLADAGDPVEQALEYDRQGADELVFLDITASSDNRAILVNVVERVADNIFIPFTVGGGIRTVEDMRDILLAGADKVSINTAAVKNPNIISEGAERFGSQCIVLAIDAKRVTPDAPNNRRGGVSATADLPSARYPSPQESVWAAETGIPSPQGSAPSRPQNPDARRLTPDAWTVFIHGGRTPTELDALQWAKQASELGAGEILLTSMDADGTRMGYDVELTRAVSSSVNIPVIASGGAGKFEHLYDVLTEGQADAVLAASIFHYRQCTVRDVKEYLAGRGIAVRL